MTTSLRTALAACAQFLMRVGVSPPVALSCAFAGTADMYTHTGSSHGPVFAVIAEAEEDLNSVMLQIKRDAEASNWKFRITYLILSLLLVGTVPI
jgi:hypothetical protein